MDDTLLKQARQLNLRNSRPGSVFPPVLLLTDDHRLPDPRSAIKQLPRNSMVIFRHYNHPDRPKLAASLRQLCRLHQIRFLVADDLGLALEISADGIHLPEYRILQTPGIYHQIPTGMITTSACHGIKTLRHMALLPSRNRPSGALISPVFSTQSHPGRSGLSLQKVQQLAMLCHTLGITPVGLGGINRKTCRNLRSSALASLAGIGFSSE